MARKSDRNRGLF